MFRYPSPPSPSPLHGGQRALCARPRQLTAHHSGLFSAPSIEKSVVGGAEDRGRRSDRTSYRGRVGPAAPACHYNGVAGLQSFNEPLKFGCPDTFSINTVVQSAAFNASTWMAWPCF